MIADEPTSALDVTVQAAVLRLLQTLIYDSASTMAMITTIRLSLSCAIG